MPDQQIKVSKPALQAEPPRRAATRVTHPAPHPAPRLAARLFAAAGNPLRARLLRCLMRPLGLLGAAGVASGVFVMFIDRRDGDLHIDADAVAQVSSQQLFELARFVEQVDPQALQQFASLVAGSPLALATFSASVLLLLSRRLQPTTAPRPPA
ncbi:MAG: hypothetical protein KF720_16210 [Rubrivivax sp.]|nr:hypothetical protein [Rubrivivax sp.]